MEKEQFVKICEEVLEEFRKLAPRDTGRLAYDAIKMEFPDDKTCTIYVNEEIAPYMPFTNEPWISPKWHGKKNPNENWWDKAAKTLAKMIAERAKGVVKNGKK